MIDRNTRDSPAPPPAEGPFRRAMEQATYEQAAAWVGACLADALHYAHARGLVHMDVKPSNVLITVDGQPMLLDFHLARGPVRAGEWVVGRLGGTPGWMSPEQELALGSVARGGLVESAVDGRSDIFALGLVLREMLRTGVDLPGRRRPTSSGLEGVSGVSVGLADVVGRCLALDPGDRYPAAASLADDLRRHVNDLPLRGVANRSPSERWDKWRRREPGALAWGVTASALLAVGVVGLALATFAYQDRVARLHLALDDARRDRKTGEFDQFIRTLTRGLDAAKGLPGLGDLRDALARELRAAQWARRADELRGLADRIRYRYGMRLPSADDAVTLVGHYQAVWAFREELLKTAGTDVDQAATVRVRTDLLEVAAVLADLRLNLASPEDRESVRREVRSLLDEAEALCGPSLALDMRRGPGVVASKVAKGGAARSAFESYDLGRYLLRSGRVSEAFDEFRKALEDRPQDFWSNFYQGLCAYRLTRFDEAVSAFRACLALAPGSGTCSYNRAIAYQALGRLDRAEADYARALTLDRAWSRPGST